MDTTFTTCTFIGLLVSMEFVSKVSMIPIFVFVKQDGVAKVVNNAFHIGIVQTKILVHATNPMNAIVIQIKQVN